MVNTDRCLNNFVFNTTPSIHCRTGAAASLGDIAGGLLGANILFITDQGVRSLGLCDAAITSLENAGARVAVFDQVEGDPSQNTVLAAARLGRERGATGVVGLGGGSSMDVAKLAALLLKSGQSLEAMWGVNQAEGGRLPLVLIPTTAGTGSEVTPLSIITVGEAEKRGVSSPLILPDIAILDAQLILKLPPAATAATGIDAMVHAIEAYTSTNINNNPVSRMLAREALRLLGANIGTAVFDGGNPAARGAMLLGSMLAGQAFANSPVGGVHALAYPVGGSFHVPHGLSNSLVLPHVMVFNMPACSAEYAELAPDVFPDLGTEADPSRRAQAFIDRLAALSKALGLPCRLRDVGIPFEAVPGLARDAMLQTRLLQNNPRVVSEYDARTIYERAW